jgi:hypothetical protein
VPPRGRALSQGASGPRVVTAESDANGPVNCRFTATGLGPTGRRDRARRVPDPAGLHGEQRGIEEEPAGHQGRSAAGQNGNHLWSTQASQAESASSILVTHSILKPQVSGLGFIHWWRPSSRSWPVRLRAGEGTRGARARSVFFPNCTAQQATCLKCEAHAGHGSRPSACRLPGERSGVPSRVDVRHRRRARHGLVCDGGRRTGLGTPTAATGGS